MGNGFQSSFCISCDLKKNFFYGSREKGEKKELCCYFYYGFDLKNHLRSSVCCGTLWCVWWGCIGSILTEFFSYVLSDRGLQESPALRMLTASWGRQPVPGLLTAKGGKCPNGEDGRYPSRSCGIDTHKCMDVRVRARTHTHAHHTYTLQVACYVVNCDPDIPCIFNLGCC